MAKREDKRKPGDALLNGAGVMAWNGGCRNQLNAGAWWWFGFFRFLVLARDLVCVAGEAIKRASP
jgi:hypothetical protein